MAVNPTDALTDQSIPQWKRELIIRRRALGRTIQVGSSTVKLTCPAVVAIVRQPEIPSASENVSAGSVKQSSSRSEDSTSTVSSLNQNGLDFHPSSTSSAVSVGNMRLLDACSDVNNLEINGIDVKNKQSEIVSRDVCVNYNLIMGEDKSLNLKKKSAPSRSKFDQNNSSVRHQSRPMLLDTISNEGTNGKQTKGEDCLSDSSEELQYGPGIVNKLKTKYLSMTLREQKKHVRPSLMNLRRATSLENMLEGDGNLNEQNKSLKGVYNKTDNGNVTVNSRTVFSSKSSGVSSHRAMKHLGNRSNEKMKRARSMDTLLKSESKKNGFGSDMKQNTLNNDFSLRPALGKPIASIVNENVIIVENQTGSVSNEPSQDAILKQESPKHSKRSGIPADKELPPPDLVKQTLKIFETSPKRKTKPPCQTNIAKLVVGYSNSTSQPINSVNNKTKNGPNKPILSPKPVLSPEKLRQSRSRVSSPKKISNHVPGGKPSSTNSPSKIKRNVEKSLQLEISEPINTSSKPDWAIGITSPKVTSPQSIAARVTVISSSEFSNSTVQSRGNVPSSNNLEEEINKLFERDELDEVDSKDRSKPVLESALENIRRGGVSIQFSFKNEDPQNSSSSKSYLPRSRSPPQALNTSLLNQNSENSLHSANIAPLRPLGSPYTKQVGIIRPLVSSKVQSSQPSSALTEQEIEKNLINRVKSIEQPISKVVVAIKALPENVVLGSVASDVMNKSLSIPRVCANSKTKTQGLWDDKLWQQTQNTMVFNFSDRKEVPDYIENDGLILRGKRERPRPGEGGIILLEGVGDEEFTTDLEAEEDLLALDPPSPCDVTFEGDNVLINGKSNLKKSPKQVKLRIKFNDEATTMFEYPSEASLVEEETQQAVSGPSSSSEVGSSSRGQAAATGPHSPLPLALGGCLGAYTPRKMGAGDWQLGVTPVVAPPVAAATPPPPRHEHLTPTPPESTVVWSEDTAADLLF